MACFWKYWACPKCRQISKGRSDQAPMCRLCRGDMRAIRSSTKTPKKADSKAWEALRKVSAINHSKLYRFNYSD